MTFRRLIRLVLAAALALGALAPSAIADPLVITGGILGYPILNDARLQTSFRNGSVNIEWSNEQGDWLPDFCCNYNPGDRIDLQPTRAFHRRLALLQGICVLAASCTQSQVSSSQ